MVGKGLTYILLLLNVTLPPPLPQVHHLTAEDFKPFLKKKKHSLVMFYAPWCGHCKAAKPEFTAAAEEFREEKKTAFAALDCTGVPSICEQHQVTGYPTFKYFNFGKIGYKYLGARSEEGFVAFMADPKSQMRDEL